MNKIRLPQLLYFGLLFVLTACQAAGQPLSAAKFRPGDTMDGMSLTTGAAAAPPLWVFCSPAQENQHVTKTDCRIPPMISKVAIGHVYNIISGMPTQLDWSEFTWKLSVDEQPIDLAIFGTYDFAMPTILTNPSPVREVFNSFTAWDVVLTNLKPGAHTVYALAQSETDTYAWIANVIVEGPYASDFGSTP
jgi:hypothetical protein